MASQQRTYVKADGSVTQEDPGWGVTDVFWGIVNGVGVFFSTMISPSATDQYVNGNSRGGSSSSSHNYGGGSTGYGGGSRITGMRDMKSKSAGGGQVPMSGG
eukprot:TRINITY_DN4902_c0_g1_i1.p1 TRINITY_DN4902_c0_g1~~TRINITY_DN4902_c0_g1_i1.p1  ORF type:complete len:102 (-),score=33.35 TRINITY_DN4902_c0_g1_i1:225-530(-)